MNDNIISRREFGMAASAAGAGLITSSKGLAANEPSGPPLNYWSGLIESPPTYYEVLEPVGGSTKPPMVLICGGGRIDALLEQVYGLRPTSMEVVMAVSKVAEISQRRPFFSPPSRRRRSRRKSPRTGE